MENVSMTPQEAYEAYQAMVHEAKRVSDAVKANFAYSPFGYLPSKFERELYEARDALIKDQAEQLRRTLVPNIKPENAGLTDFKGYVDIMDKAAGRENYSEEVLTTWFKQLASDPERVATLSRRQLLKDARQLLPWKACEIVKKVEDFYDGRCTLKLHCYTWHTFSGNQGYVSFSSQDALRALDKLIRVAVVGDPVSLAPVSTPILSVASSYKSDDAEGFYKKHEFSKTQDAIIECFTFYKNGSFMVRFREYAHAKAVAELLVSQEGVPQ